MRKAFTIIELLIVVAIISILAAIALPNFLEAQTRAKLARAKADMRTLATGLEVYGVDHHNNMTSVIKGKTASEFHSGFGPSVFHFGKDDTWSARMIRLTTPVAYISSAPRDPFEIEEMQEGYEYRS